jgi:hypothetical protein
VTPLKVYFEKPYRTSVVTGGSSNFIFGFGDTRWIGEEVEKAMKAAME